MRAVDICAPPEGMKEKTGGYFEIITETNIENKQ
jgi:hypothetical protein